MSASAASMVCFLRRRRGEKAMEDLESRVSRFEKRSSKKREAKIEGAVNLKLVTEYQSRTSTVSSIFFCQ
jgi:hypothetical protein